MFNFSENPHASAINDRIAKLLDEMDKLDGNSDDYTHTTNNLAKLLELKNQIIKTGNETTKLEIEETKSIDEHVLNQSRIEMEHRKLDLEVERFNTETEKSRSWKPSPDAIVTAAASIVGILFILHHEKVGNVVSSKALGFVGKMK